MGQIRQGKRKFWLTALVAEQRLAITQLNLGLRYADGERVPQDYTEAYVWLEERASRFPPEQTVTASGP